MGRLKRCERNLLEEKKTHTWLSKAEVKRLLDTCEDEVVGQRDRLLLGLLVGAGLRRREQGFRITIESL